MQLVVTDGIVRSIGTIISLSFNIGNNLKFDSVTLAHQEDGGQNLTKVCYF